MCLFSLRVQTVSPPRSPLAPASPTSITVSFSSWQPVWLCLLFFSLSLWSKSEILKKKKKRKNTSPSKCIWQIHCKLWIRFFFSADAEILMCQTFHAGKRVCCLFSQELQCDFTTVPSDGAHTKPAFKHNNIFSFYLYLVYTSAPHSLSYFHPVIPGASEQTALWSCPWCWLYRQTLPSVCGSGLLIL